MTTSAKNFAASATSEVVAGGVAWTNPDRVVSDNDSRATVALTFDESSENLRCVFPAYAIPAGEIVTDIILGVSGFSNAAANVTWSDSAVQLGFAALTVGVADVDALITISASRWSQAALAAGITIDALASGTSVSIALDSAWIRYVSVPAMPPPRASIVNRMMGRLRRPLMGVR